MKTTNAQHLSEMKLTREIDIHFYNPIKQKTRYNRVFLFYIPYQFLKEVINYKTVLLLSIFSNPFQNNQAQNIPLMAPKNISDG